MNEIGFHVTFDGSEFGCGWHVRVAADGIDVTWGSCGVPLDQVEQLRPLADARVLIQSHATGEPGRSVRIRRVGDTVIWDEWLPAPPRNCPPTFTFEVGAYEAELDGIQLPP